MKDTLLAIGTAIIGVAFLAVLVSRNAQTPQVIVAGGRAFSEALRSATGPVTSGSAFAIRGLTPYGGYGQEVY